MKSSPILFPLFGAEALTQAIHKATHYEVGKILLHEFPDKETLIQITTTVLHRPVILIANLYHPNQKILPLLFSAETLRSLGASHVTLVLPYLVYMRQDTVFEEGQGVTSLYFAKLLSKYFDALLTVDPHLHRWHTLNALYEIPTTVLHATHRIAAWIKLHVKNPILIGPDAESFQWVQSIAEKANVPYLILEKIRKGDQMIEVSKPNVEKYRHAIPVLVDDIISTGMTLIATVHHLQSLKMAPPICIGVHAVFAQNAYHMLRGSGVREIITCNTIPHPTNRIDMSEDIAVSLKNFNQS